MKIFILFLLHLSFSSFANSPQQMPRTSDIIQEEQQSPETPADSVELEQMNTSPNPVKGAEDESTDAIINPSQNPGPKQMQEDNEDSEDSGSEGVDEEEQGEYQSEEIKG